MSETGIKLRHLGLILDGNRRWARQKGIPTMQGHKKGYENLKTIVRAAVDRGVNYISAYVFSMENWNRSKEEVKYLMDLALHLAINEVKELHKEGIRVHFLGSKERISAKLLKAIQNAEDLTRNNTRGTVAICFNYGGKQEIADAVNACKKDIVTPDDIEQNLYAPDVPPIDLLVRTSGEQRISGFMLWRAAYAELLFVDKYWPDFSIADLDDAIQKYEERERRFGS
ncbi:di-trans,poly-cis-decaprenylcistransferase [Candidatus Saccharibacteria bacterium]|nr:di-trans,poly-cis-decaprenylcistransferase [Candidatus Saccharibacteria bacterium]MCA9337173.1 di-trans,poly-cis-decaprenylcistransferase [Candidatus Saccharibacteria bacterium]